MDRSINVGMMRAALVLGLLVGGAACKEDEPANNGGTGAVAGTMATGGVSGAMATGGTSGAMATGGTSGMGMTGGMGGSGGMMPPSMIMCGTATCTTVMSAQGPLPPCCDMDSGGGCGATVGMMGECEAIMQPGELDPTCPQAFSVIMTPVPGCCKPDNKCGVMSMTLMGCVERTDYPPAFLNGGMALEAIECGMATDGGTDAGDDGGTDAGADAGN